MKAVALFLLIAAAGTGFALRSVNRRQPVPPAPIAAPRNVNGTGNFSVDREHQKYQAYPPDPSLPLNKRALPVWVSDDFYPPNFPDACKRPLAAP